VKPLLHKYVTDAVNRSQIEGVPGIRKVASLIPQYAQNEFKETLKVAKDIGFVDSFSEYVQKLKKGSIV